MGRRLILFALALLLAVAGTGGVFAYVSNADSRALAKEQPVTALVAAKVIPLGMTAKEAQSKGLITESQLPRKTVPQGAVTKIGDIANEVAKAQVYPGEIIMAGVFGPPDPPKATGLVIPAGKMVVTVRVDDPMRVGGFVQPGSEVAIFDTFNSITFEKQPWVPSGDGLVEKFEYDRATRLLLDRVTVLAVGQSTTTPEATTAPTPSATPSPTASPGADQVAAQQQAQALLTLAVDQEQAQKLIHGEQTGALYFALLNAHSSVTPGPGVDNRHLFGDGS